MIFDNILSHPNPPHIGELLRSVIRENVGTFGARTVTEAASRLRVGRPALSNLLNGRACLSHQMAEKFERVFFVEAEAALRYQASWEYRNFRNDGWAQGVPSK